MQSRICRFVLLILFAADAVALDVSVVDDQAILSGRIDGTELVKLRDLAASNGSQVNTLILRDLVGQSDYLTLRAAGDYITDRSWRTAVSGYCGPQCFYLFMGGVERQFTDDKSANLTQIVLSGSIHTKDTQFRPLVYQGETSNRGNFWIRPWIEKRTGGRIGDDLLSRIMATDASPAMAHLYFFDSNRLRRKDGASLFLCTGKENPKTKWEECEKIFASNAYLLGIVTSPELVRSKDRK